MIKDGNFLFFVATHENYKSIVIVWISYVADVTSSSGFNSGSDFSLNVDVSNVSFRFFNLKSTQLLLLSYVFLSP